MMPQTLTGGCLCGAVRYTVDVPIAKLIACYCTDCQRATSAGGSINALIPASAFKIVKGQTRVFSKHADSGNILHRHFCADCGSWIYNPRGGDPEQIVLKVGTLDQHDDMKIVLNIWTQSRRPWAPIDPTIPAYSMGKPPSPAA
jgi:hypothetical protein